MYTTCWFNLITTPYPLEWENDKISSTTALCSKYYTSAIATKPQNERRPQNEQQILNRPTRSNTMHKTHSCTDRLNNKSCKPPHFFRIEVADRRAFHRRRSLDISNSATSLHSLNSKLVYRVLPTRLSCRRCYRCTLRTIGCVFDIEKGGTPTWVPSRSRGIMRSSAPM